MCYPVLPCSENRPFVFCVLFVRVLLIAIGYIICFCIRFGFRFGFNSQNYLFGKNKYIPLRKRNDGGRNYNFLQSSRMISERISEDFRYVGRDGVCRCRLSLRICNQNRFIFVIQNTILCTEQLVFRIDRNFG